MNKNILVVAFMFGLVTPVLSKASETNAIEALRFDPIEMHYGDIAAIELVSGDVLGEMPVPILDDSSNGFVQVLLPDGSEAWVNRSDVQIGGVEIIAICAKARVYSQLNDRKSAHLRGVSRECP